MEPRQPIPENSNTPSGADLAGRHVEAVITGRAWLRRTLTLRGAVETTVELNARGYPESWVRVGGEIVVTDHDHRSFTRGPWTFRFVVPSPQGDLQGALTVYVPLGDVRWLRLCLDGVVVYSEEEYGRRLVVGRKPIDLPIPAAAPAPTGETLPRAANAPAAEAADHTRRP